MAVVDNLIEVKSGERADPELAFQLAQKVQCLPGRVAVLVDPIADTTDGGIYLPSGKWEGSQASDTGIVIGSGVRQVKLFDRVAFLPLHGLRCDSSEFDWIPDGVEVRFYGVSCHYYESMVVLED